MFNKSDNPFKIIFIKDQKGAISDEIDSIDNIRHFFEFIKDDKIKEDLKIKVLDELKKKIHSNRTISEFFSTYENKSIYIHLFNLYTNKNSSDKLKKSILSLIEELCPNIQTGKDVFEYLFQKLAKIYRGEIQPTSTNLYHYLNLLSSVLCEIDSITKPRNYFACSGNCKFVIDMSKREVKVAYSFTIIISIFLSEIII